MIYSHHSISRYRALLKYLGVSVCPVFFFQAEDGIRDLIVTGVQTCALPISRPERTVVDARLALHPQLHRIGPEAVAAPVRWARNPDLHAVVGAGTAGSGRAEPSRDRKSVVKGKSVDLGGRRIIKKKKKK